MDNPILAAIKSIRLRGGSIELLSGEIKLRQVTADEKTLLAENRDLVIDILAAEIANRELNPVILSAPVTLDLAAPPIPAGELPEPMPQAAGDVQEAPSAVQGASFAVPDTILAVPEPHAHHSRPSRRLKRHTARAARAAEISELELAIADYPRAITEYELSFVQDSLVHVAPRRESPVMARRRIRDSRLRFEALIQNSDGNGILSVESLI